MVTTEAERLLTVAEAAEQLGVSVSTVWRWIDARRLPAVRIGARKIRIRGDDVAAMIVPARTGEPAGSHTASDPDGRPSPVVLARRRQAIEEIMKLREKLSESTITATEALAIADAMQQEHDEYLAGVRR